MSRDFNYRLLLVLMLVLLTASACTNIGFTTPCPSGFVCIVLIP